MINVSKCIQKYRLGIIASLLILAGIVYIYKNNSALASNTYNIVTPSRTDGSATPGDQVANNTPVKIVIEKLNVQLAVNKGDYEATSATWDLDDSNAFYASGTSASLIYGHNTQAVFGQIHKLVQEDIVQLTYSDGTIKYFQMVNTRLVKPDDSSVLFESNPRELMLLTCSGIFNENRRLVYLQEMDNTALVIYTMIAVLSLLNFIRIFVMLIGADVYDIKFILNNKRKVRPHRPFISIIIPAYNEETGVIRTVESVRANNYKNKEIIVVNDGSRDDIKKVLLAYQRKNPGVITVVNQANGGKAAALNRGIFKWVKGSLVMVLDADSLLHPNALSNMANHFRDRKIIAAASNVKVLPSKKVLGIAQQIEYLISYRMKRSLSTLNMEYIVGGVGSTFRRRQLVKVGGYDTDTITEDIDLTVKLIEYYGNKNYRIQYAANCLTYTEHVLSLGALIKQRFRWKYGRFQTLLKYQSMFFSRSRKYDKKLTWIQFPYALIGEFVLLLEPLLIGYILALTIIYADTTSLAWAYLIVTSFVFLMLLGEHTETCKTKITLSLFLPFVYILMYILAFVEFMALFKSIKQSKKLFNRTMEKSSWEHVARSSEAVIVSDLIK